MTAAFAVYVAIGGFTGACARYGVNVWMRRRFPSQMLLATLLVNLSGSLLLGVLAGSEAGETASGLLAIGFLGSYTTFSTFILEIVTLTNNGSLPKAAWYGVASMVIGISLAYAGYLLVTF